MRVLEIGGLAAGYCGRLFQATGADVVRVARDTDRSAWVRDEALQVFLHRGKRGVDVCDRDVILQLAAASDVVVVEGSARAVIDETAGMVPRHALVTISPFGLLGPKKDWRATGSTLLAMGGYTYLMGDPGREPLGLPGHYVEYQSGQHAFIAANALLLEGETGQRVDISMWEVVLSLSQFTTVMWQCDGDIRNRHGNDFGVLYPINVFACADGWFHVNVIPQFWDAFVCMLERPELSVDERFADNTGRLENRAELDAIINESLGHLTKSDIMVRAADARVPTGVLQELDEVLLDPHLASRQFWQRERVGDAEVALPRLPFREMA